MPDANTVIDAFERCMCGGSTSCHGCYQDGPGFGYECRRMLCEDVLALLKEQNSCENCAVAIEDRVMVVRCKDCKYYDGNGTCMKNGIALLADHWFCADGERRDSDA